MKKILSLSALLTIALLIGTACQTASTANTTANNANKALPNNTAPKADEHGHTDDAPRISLADAKKDFDAGNAIFVDTRDEAAYKNEHIKGAVNISMNAVEAKYKELPTGKKIIAYCS
ncbi:MAG: rhodanese-like domain-containing protein [Pyrinomonadaceae bacterium]|nr:rhodanese-like domain-containing protein [Pyrinomonadaceae bacterium]